MKFAKQHILTIIVSTFVIIYIFFPIYIVALWAFAEKWPGTMWWFPTQLGTKWWDITLGRGTTVRAFLYSFTLAPLSTFFTFLISLPAAFVLGTRDFPGKETVENFFMIPYIIPHMTIAAGILSMYMAIGLTNNYWGLCVVFMIGEIPWMLKALTLSFLAVDKDLEHAARNLGANTFTVVRKVYLPLIVPGIVAGSLFSMSFALNEFMFTLMLGLPDYRTLSVEISRLIFGYYVTPPAAAVLSLVLIIPAIIFTFAIEKLVGLEIIGRITI